MKIGFYSCMGGVPWGGSEELWFRAATRLQADGHNIFVNYKWWPRTPHKLQKLQSGGADLWFRMQPPGFWESKVAGLKHLFFGQVPRPNAGNIPGDWIEQKRPDCVLVTLGYHPDQVQVADDCLKYKIPYAINVQAASSFSFIHGEKCKLFRPWYQGAKKVFFVSEENRDKVETNLAMKLDNAEIVDNPFNSVGDEEIPFPTASGLRLACVGRIHFQSKGQDMIVDVLRKEKWRERDIVISIYGKDQGQMFQLQQLIELHGLQEKIKIPGFVNDVSEIWKENHGLLLPSRYEGAALVVVEAMMSKRACVVTDTGRNRELIDEGKSGFVADSATVHSIDAAMEKAWQARSQFQALGETAGADIRQRYSADPVADYAAKILELGT